MSARARLPHADVAQGSQRTLFERLGERLFPAITHDPADLFIVDLFAGGGGASDGIRRALGRCPNVAVNHDAHAIAMHEANHPASRHYHSDVFEVDPRELARAMGFRDDYVMIGTKAQQVKRIGNSVSPDMAEAMVLSQFPQFGSERRMAA